MCDPVGFMIYSGMLMTLYISLINRNYFVLCIGFFLCTFIAAFRGEAGIDTYLYIARFNAIEPGFSGFYNIPIIESFLPFLMWITKTLGGSFIHFSILFGAIISLLYFRILKNIPNSIYFGLACFPVIYIDSLFNGVRIGLAYPLIFLAIFYSSSSLFTLGIFSHISALIAAPFKIFSNKNFFIFIMLTISFLIIFDSEIAQLFLQRFDSKFNQYQNIYTRNAYGGIADSSLLYVASLIFLRSKNLNGKSFLMTAAPLLIGVVFLHIFLVSQYVFMLRVVRFLDIIFFALASQSSRDFDKLSFYLSLSFGVLYSLNFLRQIASSCNYDLNNGFLPLIHNLL